MRNTHTVEKGKILPIPNRVFRQEPIIDYLAENYSDHAAFVVVALKIKAMLERKVKVSPEMVDYLFEEALQDKVAQNIAERKRKREQHNERTNSQGYTYFLRNGDRIKIGFSRNPKARAESLSLRESNILGVIESGQKFERMLHDNWAHIRIGDTEWFEATPELLKFIDESAMRWHYRHASRQQKKQTIQQGYINLARKLAGEI